MKTLLLTALLASTLAHAGDADAPPEVQIVLQSLRAGERARVEAALGDATQLPLYRGDFTLDPVKRTVTGRYALTVTPKAAGTRLRLRVTPNAAHPSAVTLTKSKVMRRAVEGQPASEPGKVTLNQPEPSMYEVVIEPAYKPGEQLTLELELKAKVPRLNQQAGGLGALSGSTGGDYGAFSGSDDVVSLVGLVPMLVPELNGRPMAGPSGVGDLGTAEPGHLIASVTVPSGWRVVGSGLQMGEVPTGTGQVRFAYGIAAARELPLVVVKRPKVATKRFGDVDVEAVLFDGDASDADAVLEHAGSALTLLEQTLGPYPYKNFRVAEMRLVGGAGGMEFPGMVTVSATMLSESASPLSALGFDPAQAQALQGMFGNQLTQLMKSTLEFTIDHEVAHQYSAMLVGSDPVLEPVADEPLTQHLALLLLEWRRGKAAADQMRQGQLKAAYQLHRMMGGEDGKANRPTGDFDSNQEYAAIIYGKAPLLFDEVRAMVGDETWERSLKTYVEQNRYRFVTSRTLFEVVSKQSPSATKKIEALRKRWWEESHGDDDIGGFDLGSLMGAMGGSGGMDPKEAAKAFEDFEKAMKALSGE